MYVTIRRWKPLGEALSSALNTAWAEPGNSDHWALVRAKREQLLESINATSNLELAAIVKALNERLDHIEANLRV